MDIDLRQMLLQAVEDFHELSKYRWSGVRCKKDPIIKEMKDNIPSFTDLVEVERVGDEINWSFTIPEEIEEHVSMTSSKMTTSVLEQVKMRHEFVAECFGKGGTDMKLLEKFLRLNDEDDILTPDFIFETPSGFTHVVEIATSRSQSTRSLKDVLDGKIFKYEGPLINRSQDRIITYTVVVVSPTCVTSNVTLPNEIVYELLIRMAISIAIENAALAKGIRLKLDEHTTKAVILGEQILDGISKIKFSNIKDENAISISEEYYRSVLVEPDIDMVKEAFMTSKQIALEKTLEPRDHWGQKTSFLQKLKSESNKRHDLKPVVSCPLFAVKPSTPSTKPIFSSVVSGSLNPQLTRLWMHCLSAVNVVGKWKEENINDLRKEAYSTTTKEVKSREEARHRMTRQYHRVDISTVLDNKMKSYLARDGVFAKSFKDNIEHKVRVRHQKQSFNFDTPTEDVDSFISDASMLDVLEWDLPNSVGDTLTLVGRGMQVANNGKFNMCELKTWCKTRIFRSLEIQSDIAAELSISLKQNTKKKEMILKKLRHYNVNLLIKTTNSDSHIFYSVMVPNEFKPVHFHGTVFKPLVQSGKNQFSEFSSMNKDKIANFLTAPSRLLTMIAFWSDFYNLKDYSIKSFKAHPAALKMLLLSMLISLENKAETEETITQSRYMYMEVFKSTVSSTLPDPFKVLSKMTTKPRSRLNLWCLKQIVHNFEVMIKFPPVRVRPESDESLDDGEDSLPGDVWSNLLNCLIGGSVGTSSAAVNLMYLGYLKDKNESGNANSEWGLVEKIVQEEMDIRNPKDKGHYGEVIASELPGKKKFSKQCIMFGCSLMEKKLKNTLGVEWKSVLTIEIRDALARQLTHEIATLKASSSISHGDTDRVTNKVDCEKTIRVKVIEAIACSLKMMDLNPFLALEEIIKKIELTSRGVICDLFKKQQHGGLREIYVLTIESRVLQLFIETISRVLCSYFEEETLTHPQNKLKILDQHKVRSAKIGRSRNAVFADFCSSSDKTRWNQNFVMTSMCIPLFRMTEEKFHGAIARVLNLWSSKLIKLPPGVCSLLQKNTQLSSPVFKELSLKYRRRTSAWSKQKILKKPGSPFLQITSGMMQGILHYTSSLLHITFLQSCKFLTLSYMVKKYLKSEYRFTMSQVCSSDDSATILTVFSCKDMMDFTKDDLIIFLDADSCLHAMTHFCRFYNMVESIKSTIGMYDYVEFNSEFLFKNTLAVPIIKFVAASLNLTESESFILRFHELYNLMSNVFTSGLPSYNTMLCQVAQAFLHYKTVGASTSGLFADFVLLISEFPDPVHGFFLFDSELCPGLLGYSFSLWQAMRTYPELLCSQRTVNYSELEATPEGIVIDSLSIKHGELYRWKKLICRINKATLRVKTSKLESDSQGRFSKKLTMEDQEILASINKNPELLFRHPQNLRELKEKLLLKASMPGVAKSLSKGNPLIQAISSSVHSLFTHCFSKTTVSASLSGADDVLKRSKMTKKLSLLSSLKGKLDESKQSNLEGTTDELIRTLFPLHEKYTEALIVMEQYSLLGLKPTHPFRQTKSVIKVLPNSVSLPITLLQAVSRWWFGLSIKVSQNMFKRCISEYQAMYPWLSDTIEETLRGSPFSTYVELYGFISGQNNTTRTILRYGPAVRGSSFESQVAQIVRRCYKRNSLLCEGDFPEANPSSMSNLRAKAALSLTIPIRLVREAKLRQILGRISRVKPKPEDWLGSGVRDFSLAMIALYSNGIISAPQLQDLIRQKGCGTVIMFTKEQKRVYESGKLFWSGEGECVVISEGVKMILELKDRVVRRIKTKDIALLRRNAGVLRDVFERLGCRAYTGKSFEVRGAMRFDGARFQHIRGVGTPVIVIDDMDIPKVEYSQLHIRTNPGSCQLIASVNKRETAILKFASSLNDIESVSNPQSVSDPWSAWVNCEKLGPGEAINFIDDTNKLLQEGSLRPQEDQLLRSWLNDSLNKRLKYLGIGYSNMNYGESVMTTIYTEEEEGDDSFDDWLEEEMMREATNCLDTNANSVISRLIDSTNNALFEELAIEGMLEEAQEVTNFDEMMKVHARISPFNAILHNWSEEERAITRTIHSYNLKNGLYLHPFWDGIIQFIHSEDSKFFSLTLQGIINRKEPDLSTKFMKILDIKPRTKELNITERLARLSNRMTSLEEEDVDNREHEGSEIADVWWSAEEEEFPDRD